MHSTVINTHDPTHAKEESTRMMSVQTEMRCQISDYAHPQQGTCTPQKACDNCYQRKERCGSTESKDRSCDRCRRLGRKCTCSRPVKRIGRPGAVAPLPHGSSQILVLDVQPDLNAEPGEISCHNSTGKSTKLGPLHYRKGGSDLNKNDPAPAQSLPSSDPSCRTTIEKNTVVEDAHGFAATHRYFVIGPSFMAKLHAVVQWLVSSTSNRSQIEGYMALLNRIRHLELLNSD